MLKKGKKDPRTKEEKAMDAAILAKEELIRELGLDREEVNEALRESHAAVEQATKGKKGKDEV